jgi:SAM-dependent methyltransferase
MNRYKSLYIDLKFERAELFQFVQQTYACREVLYPGCSIHITPSLYFPHVVYVDQSQDSAQFFAEEKVLNQFVNRKKSYKQPGYVRFIHQDYSAPLPLMDNSFDLLLAIFAGGISRACARYLKAGGILVSNNHHGDAVDAARDHRLQFRAVIHYDKGKYHIDAENSDKGKFAVQKPDSRYLKQTSHGMGYVENETYYVFKRLH